MDEVGPSQGTPTRMLPLGGHPSANYSSLGERERREAHREAGHLTMKGPECSVRLQGRRRCVRVSEAYPL